MRMACTLACSGGEPPPGGSRRVQGSASLLSSRGHRTCAVSVVWNSRARRAPHRADGLGPQRHGDTWTLPAAPGAKQQVLQREPRLPLEEAPPGRRYAPPLHGSAADNSKTWTQRVPTRDERIHGCGARPSRTPRGRKGALTLQDSRRALEGHAQWMSQWEKDKYHPISLTWDLMDTINRGTE